MKTKLYGVGSPLGLQFAKVVKGKNFMTPYLLGFAKIPGGVVEVTEGDKFAGDEMFGITVVRDGKQDHDASKCVHSHAEIDQYIQELRKKQGHE